MESIILLNRSELIENIKTMFTEEKNRLIIVSPFNNKEKNTILLEKLLKSNARIYLFFREPLNKNDKNIIKFKDAFKKINFFEIKNLHAKAYISTKETIISSMNLNGNDSNFEFGLKFDNTIYSEFYKKIINELKILLENNKYDKNIIEDNEIYLEYDEYNRTRQDSPILNMKYLYRAIMKKNNMDWKKEEEYNDDIYKKVSSQMDKKFNFDETNFYKYENVLKRQTELDKEQYKYGINNITIDA